MATRSALRVARLGPAHTGHLAALIDRDPVNNVYLRSELRLGFDAGDWWGAFAENELTSVAVSYTHLEDRALWKQYQAAYSEAITRTSTKDAPWYIIPSDHKWYRNWVISRLLIETLTEMDPKYPEPPDLAGIKIT